jgi:tRNA (adenine-N(1)-)-methyltransferase non-catalytic subunit
LANPRAVDGVATLVVEQCSGLITAAAAERLGGRGLLLHLHPHAGPNLQAIKYANLEPRVRATVHTLRMKYVRQLMQEREAAETAAAAAMSQPPAAETASADSMEMAGAASSSSFTADSDASASTSVSAPVTSSSSSKSAAGSRLTAPALTGGQFMPPSRTVDEVLAAVRGVVFSSLLMATDAALFPLADIIIAALSPSASFVIYAASSEHLAALYLRLRNSRIAVNLQLSETWFREYQMLPNRTHPDMNMSGGGGYILSGTRVHAPEWTVDKVFRTYYGAAAAAAASGSAGGSAEAAGAAAAADALAEQEALEPADGDDNDMANEDDAGGDDDQGNGEADHSRAKKPKL